MAGKKGRFKGTAILASIGINLVVSTFVGLAIGYYLDMYLGTMPWLTIVFLFVGIAAGFKHLFTASKRYGDFDGDDDKGGSDE